MVGNVVIWLPKYAFAIRSPGPASTAHSWTKISTASFITASFDGQFVHAGPSMLPETSRTWTTAARGGMRGTVPALAHRKLSGGACP